MKKYAFLFLTLLAISISCKDVDKNSNKISEERSSEVKSLEGAWELVSFLNYSEDGTVDTIESSNNYKQMKMFSESKIMWSRLRTGDSLDWFGVGDYTFKDGLLTEVLDYGSKAMNERIRANKHWNFKILIDENSYTQIELDSLGNPIYAENYQRVQ